MKRKKQFVYLVTLNDEYELPLACFDTIRECASYLGLNENTCAYAVYRHSVLCEKYLIFKVQI